MVAQPESGALMIGASLESKDQQYTECRLTLMLYVGTIVWHQAKQRSSNWAVYQQSQESSPSSLILAHYAFQLGVFCAFLLIDGLYFFPTTLI